MNSRFFAPLLRTTLLACLLLAASLLSAEAAWAGDSLNSGAPGRRSHNQGTLERSKVIPGASTTREHLAGLTDLQQPSTAPDPLEVFAASVTDGSASVLRGVYVPDVLALRVVQQTASYQVNLTEGVATQFGMASGYGVTGLLADNIASGTLYEGLAPGQVVTLIDGDGSQRRYQVQTINRFQALRPADPYTDFVHLDSGARLSSTQLFTQMYTGGDKVIFQTCIARDGIMNWGRLFVTATPIP